MAKLLNLSIFDIQFPLILNIFKIIQFGKKYALILASKFISELVNQLKTVETRYFNV